ncbi:antitoxin Xre/MbcA/ParS toxin-binding domain-containing protein [Ralstonia syzygii]|uniref:antitoxin Xre/MbcA/ParS toxin-binding domain-containing protein n=1 Tax=Ralstonia solanacearum species complex TaxID=3116862 RepID=UPI0013C2EF7D
MLEQEWQDNDITEELSHLTNDQEIAKAIWGSLRSESVKWLHRPVPMLESQCPIDLLHTEEGRGRVRWMLISNPWW